MIKPILYIFSGLPGAGKSTLAQALARQTGAMYLRIDTIEQGIRDLCQFRVEGEGYRLAYRIAADNLKLGTSVIADSCNPVRLTRDEWQDVADSSGADFRNIEIICSDKEVHRQRVETRQSEVAGLKLPGWEQVMNREYHAWHTDRIIIDTAGKTASTCRTELLEEIQK